MARSTYGFDPAMLRSFQTALGNAKHVVVLTGSAHRCALLIVKTLTGEDCHTHTHAKHAYMQVPARLQSQAYLHFEVLEACGESTRPLH